MALGFSVSSGSDFLPICKYDSRAGRMYKRDRDPSGEWVQTDITKNFKAVFDFASANFEIGWMNFNTGGAPEFTMVPHGEPMPAQPSPNHKQGCRVLIMLSKDLDGSVREIASNAKAFLRGISDLHDEYLAKLPGNEGKLPVVTLEDTVAISTGNGATKTTNYSPVFAIKSWIDRPAQLVAKAKPKVAPPVQSAPAPVTGSVKVAPPSPADSGDDFG